MTFIKQSTTGTNMVICKYFLQGTCRFGNQCRYEHTEATSSSTSILRKSSDADTIILLNTVREDVEVAKKGQQWPLSCYGPFDGRPCLPGFVEKSFEEVRFGFWEAKKNGSVEQYKQQLLEDLQVVTNQRNVIQNPTAEVTKMIRCLFDSTPAQITSPSTSNIFGNSPSSPQSGSSIFGNTTSPSIFGGTSSVNTNTIFSNTQSSAGLFPPQNQNTPTNIFAGAATQNQPNSGNIFSNVFQNQGNVFGGTGNVFGGNNLQQNQASSGNVFGGGNIFANATQSAQNSGNIFANSPPQNSGNLFGGNSMQQNNIFGNAVQNSPNLFGNNFQQNTGNIFAAQTQANSQNLFKTQQNIFSNNTSNFSGNNSGLFSSMMNSGKASGDMDTGNIFAKQGEVQSNNLFETKVQDSNVGIGNTVSPKVLLAQQANKCEPACYSKLEDLKDSDIEQFNAERFDFGKIPTKPPSYEQCF